MGKVWENSIYFGGKSILRLLCAGEMPHMRVFWGGVGDKKKARAVKTSRSAPTVAAVAASHT